MPRLQVPGNNPRQRYLVQKVAVKELTVDLESSQMPMAFTGGGGGPSNLTLPDSCPPGMGRGTEADGGTPILSYKVEDTSEWFNSTNALPEKGFYEVTNLAGGEPYQYTIPDLTKRKDILLGRLRTMREVIALPAIKLAKL